MESLLKCTESTDCRLLVALSMLEGVSFPSYRPAGTKRPEYFVAPGNSLALLYNTHSPIHSSGELCWLAVVTVTTMDSITLSSKYWFNKYRLVVVMKQIRNL